MAASLACEFALSSPTIRQGASCDRNGAYIDSVPLLRKRYSAGREIWEPRDCETLSAEIGARYGLPIDISSRANGLNAIAAALNGGDIARAQLATLFLRFPVPPQFSERTMSRAEAIKFVRELDSNRLLKTWEPDQHPRWPAGTPDSQGGQFAPKDAGEIRVADTDADPEDDEVESQLEAEAQSRTNWAAAEAAGRKAQQERDAEASGAETPQMSRSRINRVRSAREREQRWKDEAKKDPSLRALDSLLNTPENISRMMNGRSPIGEDGYPMELHHPEGDPDAEVVPMTQTEHRRGENYLRNHPWLRPKKRMVDIYASEVNRAGNLGAFFEADERTGWLYLCHVFENGDVKIIKPMNVLNRAPDFTESEVEVRWFDDDRKVGVLIKGQLYAYFNVASEEGIRGRYPSAPLNWPSQ